MKYPALFVTKNNFHNLPADIIQDDTLRDYGLAMTCQFYMDK